MLRYFQNLRVKFYNYFHGGILHVLCVCVCVCGGGGGHKQFFKCIGGIGLLIFYLYIFFGT